MRIFVFRPQSDAQRSAQAIRARGHEPVLAPLFTLARLPDAAPEGDFAAIVLTSGNAVPALTEGPAAWRELPVFSVGARTAEAARAAGFGDARSAGGDRHDLAELIGSNMPAGARLLLIVGRDRHEDLPEVLTKAGFSVDIWTAYAAEAVATLPKEAAKAIVDGQVDAALHYSPRGAETFVRLTNAVHLGDEAMALTHVALSAEVAAPLIAAGADTVLVAEHPEEAALLAALDQVSARNRRGEGATDSAIAPAGVETDTDMMGDTETSAPKRPRSRRTPPTLEAQAQEVTEAAAGATAPEAVLPTEALPEEFSPPPVAEPAPDAEPEAKPTIAAAATRPEPAPQPRRSPLPAMALAGIVGGVIGAGLVMLAMSRTTPVISAEEVAGLRSQLAGLQSRTDALQGQTAAAAKAGTDAQAASARASELATAAQRAQIPDASAIASLSEQAKRAEAATAAIGQRLDQAAARIGSVETLAKTAAEPSPQAMAAARIVLAERVRTALASGQPFASDVAALQTGGGAAGEIAALNAVAATGAPTQGALLARFKTHQAMFAREMTPANAGWQEQLLGIASRVVTIRPVGDTGANDPSTLVMRLENAISGGRIAMAASLWGQLPEPARRASAEFGANLQKRAAADAAIAKIAQDAVAALGAAG
jgi:uroporphyrinogen-III synthase